MEFNFINLCGLAIVLIMLLPNILYAARFHSAGEERGSKAMYAVEQVGRFASFFLMCLPLGVWEFGFSNVIAFFLYTFGNTALLLAYLLVWAAYFRKPSAGKALSLAILPTCIFLLSGLTLRHWLLAAAAVLFGAGHIYVTYQNNKA